MGFFSSFWNVSGRYKSSWIRSYITSVTNKRTHCTDKLCDSPTQYWEESHVSDTHTKWLARKSQSFIAFSRVSGRYVKHFSDAKVQIFWLAPLRSLDIIFLKFLVSNEQDHIMSVTNTVMDILYRQTVINQQCIIFYILRFEKNRMFSTHILKNRLARFARLAILYTFSPVSIASSFNKAIYHEHIEWTNTSTYCTDKNMLLTNLTIARFQRKIRKFRLARLQSVTYVFRYVL